MTPESIDNLHEAFALVLAGLIFVALLVLAADPNSPIVRFFRARESKKHSPHSYSTGICHKPLPCKPCNSGGVECLSCRKGL